MTEDRTPTPSRGIPVELDRTRRVRYSLRTLRELCEEFGVDLDELDELELKISTLGKFLWYGLRHEDPELTVEDVEDLVDMQNIQPLRDAVLEAIGGGPADSTPSDDAGGGEAAVPPTQAAIEDEGGAETLRAS